MKKKYCYICIPITNREDDVFERASIATKEIIKLGYIPINPLDINTIEEKELTNEVDIQTIATCMGKDIETIISKCDAIYCCDGWEFSKGCNVERECAKQYNINILYQTKFDIRKEEKFLDTINQKRNQIVNSIIDASKQNDKDYYNALKRDLENFDRLMTYHFNVEFNEKEHYYNFK
jgi:hypothetical protein